MPTVGITYGTRPIPEHLRPCAHCERSTVQLLAITPRYWRCLECGTLFPVVQNSVEKR